METLSRTEWSQLVREMCDSTEKHRKAMYGVPINERPPPTLLVRLYAILFNVAFPLAMLVMHLVQLASLPLGFLSVTLPLYDSLRSWFKEIFGRLLVVIVMVWAPTTLRITVDRDDKYLSLDTLVQRDENDRPIGLKLPHRMILIANHQVYCDWNYIWNLLYLADLHSSVTIMLKASLKWVPLIGPAMQLFRFVFIQKDWSRYQASLAHTLKQSARGLKPFVLVLFPEGTLVSSLTRPLSLKYAEKTGIHDMQHTLLPRSTGLLFCLRTLAPVMPDLQLLDVTIAYPGVPNGGYGQTYYTLQSIFGAGVPPPVISMHLRSYSAAKELPIRNLDVGSTFTTEATEAESKSFNHWLLQRWQEKDERLESFLKEGTFAQNSEYVDIPVRLKSNFEILILALSWFLGFWIAKLIWVSMRQCLRQIF